LSAARAGGRSLVGLLFRLSLFVLVVIAIVVVIIAALAGKPDSANELNLSRPRERGPIRYRTMLARSVSQQGGLHPARVRAADALVLAPLGMLKSSPKADSNHRTAPHGGSTEDEPQEKAARMPTRRAERPMGLASPPIVFPGCGAPRSSRGAERLSGERQGRSRSPR